MKIYPPLMVLVGLVIQGTIAFMAPLEPMLVPLWQYIGVGLMLSAFALIIFLARGFSKTKPRFCPTVNRANSCRAVSFPFRATRFTLPWPYC